MDIGLITNNNTYYTGFEGEEELILALPANPDLSIHLWIEYLDDILSAPPLNGREWSGFTKDYHQLIGAFDGSGRIAAADPKEYLEDLQQYSGKTFREPETSDVYQLIHSFLEYAVDNKQQFTIQVN